MPPADQAPSAPMGGHRPERYPPITEPSRGGRGLRQRTLQGMVIMAASTGGQAVLQLVFLSILARALSPDEFGLVSGALIVVFLATALAESGVGQAVIQRAELTAVHLRVGWTLSLLTGMLSWGLVALLAPAIEDLLRLPGLTPILRVIALMFVLNGLTLSDFLLSRRLQFGRLAMAELASYAVGYGGVAITLALLGCGPWAIVWGQLGQSAMRTVLVTCLAPFRYRPCLYRSVAGDLLNFGAGLTLGRLGSWAATQMDNFVVGRCLGAAALGLYGRAYQLVQMPANLFGQVANEVLFPAMSAVQHEHAKLRRVFGLGTGLLAALALPVSLLAAVSSDALVRVLLGPEWLGLRTVFDVIIFGLLFRTTSKLADALMKARGAVYRRALRNLAFAAMVLLGAAIGQHWGLEGVGIGVLAALGLNYLYTSQLCLALIGMRWREFLAAHLPAVILATGAALVGLVAQLVLSAAGSPYLVRLLVVWLLGIATCLLLVRIAWRTRLLASVAGLVAAVHGLLSGAPARILARLLGPGYRAVLHAEKLPMPGPRRAAALAAEERIDDEIDGRTMR
ncbi:MAG: lipopolysaccharide biosynthesis protein [Nocardioides sp.]|uniref:lipopolysaccharide biosynthesis protein n=1 Tax=Nocardioides sp. TaxID=35761 RepID=UPI0039E50E48